MKNIIVMIGDGAGFNTLEATRLYLQALPPGDPRGGVGGPLVMDGPGWVYTAQSVYPLDTRTRPVAGQAGLEQNPVTYYNPAVNHDLRPVEGNTAPVAGLAPGARWAEIPDDWCCPDCGTAKSEFEMVEIA